ncbi:mucin-2-like isoform X2 [Scylla paramamosain]
MKGSIQVTVRRLPDGSPQVTCYRTSRSNRKGYINFNLQDSHTLGQYSVQVDEARSGEVSCQLVPPEEVTRHHRERYNDKPSARINTNSRKDNIGNPSNLKSSDATDTGTTLPGTPAALRQHDWTSDTSNPSTNLDSTNVSDIRTSLPSIISAPGIPAALRQRYEKLATCMQESGLLPDQASHTMYEAGVRFVASPSKLSPTLKHYVCLVYDDTASWDSPPPSTPSIRPSSSPIGKKHPLTPPSAPSSTPSSIHYSPLTGERQQPAPSSTPSGTSLTPSESSAPYDTSTVTTLETPQQEAMGGIMARINFLPHASRSFSTETSPENEKEPTDQPMSPSPPATLSTSKEAGSELISLPLTTGSPATLSTFKEARFEPTTGVQEPLHLYTPRMGRYFTSQPRIAESDFTLSMSSTHATTSPPKELDSATPIPTTSEPVSPAISDTEETVASTVESPATSTLSIDTANKGPTSRSETEATSPSVPSSLHAASSVTLESYESRQEDITPDTINSLDTEASGSLPAVHPHFEPSIANIPRQEPTNKLLISTPTSPSALERLHTADTADETQLSTPVSEPITLSEQTVTGTRTIPSVPPISTPFPSYLPRMNAATTRSKEEVTVVPLEHHSVHPWLTAYPQPDYLPTHKPDSEIIPPWHMAYPHLKVLQLDEPSRESVPSSVTDYPNTNLLETYKPIVEAGTPITEHSTTSLPIVTRPILPSTVPTNLPTRVSGSFTPIKKPVHETESTESQTETIPYEDMLVTDMDSGDGQLITPKLQGTFKPPAHEIITIGVPFHDSTTEITESFSHEAEINDTIDEPTISYESTMNPTYSYQTEIIQLSTEPTSSHEIETNEPTTVHDAEITERKIEPITSHETEVTEPIFSHETAAITEPPSLAEITEPTIEPISPKAKITEHTISQEAEFTEPIFEPTTSREAEITKSITEPFISHGTIFTTLHETEIEPITETPFDAQMNETTSYEGETVEATLKSLSSHEIETFEPTIELSSSHETEAPRPTAAHKAGIFEPTTEPTLYEREMTEPSIPHEGEIIEPTNELATTYDSEINEPKFELTTHETQTNEPKFELTTIPQDAEMEFSHAGTTTMQATPHIAVSYVTGTSHSISTTISTTPTPPGTVRVPPTLPDDLVTPAGSTSAEFRGSDTEYKTTSSPESHVSHPLSSSGPTVATASVSPHPLVVITKQKNIPCDFSFMKYFFDHMSPPCRSELLRILTLSVNSSFGGVSV